MRFQSAITLDIDWAPDWAIDAVCAILKENGARATWFVTHMSPAVERLQANHELFELGLHPNFLPGSTHGDSEDAVLRHMRALLPEATAMRSHSLHQNSHLLSKAAREFGVRVDASLLLPGASNLTPHTLWLPGASIRRVPSCWEDDIEMLAPSPCYDADAPYLNGPGVHVFNFHPIHVVLNTTAQTTWEDIKKMSATEDCTPEALQRLRCDAPGPATLFLELARRQQGRGKTISELAASVEDRAC